MGKLTAKTIERLQPRDRPYEQADGDGLYVTVRPNGSRSFNLRYRFGGKPRNMTIAPASIGLDAARKLTREALVLLARGVDPGVEKAERKVSQAAANAPTGAPRDLVESVVAEFVTRYAKAETRAWEETARVLNKDVVGAWEGRRLSEISKTDVHSLLDGIIDRGAPIAANRTFATVRGMCRWAVKRGLIVADPTAGLDKPVSEKGRARKRILNDAELGAVWRASDRLGFPFGPITQLLMLTGQRRGEVAGMTWSEIDLDARVWAIPESRSKNGRGHVVPLAPRAVAILRSLPRFARRHGETDFVFSPGASAPSGFSPAKVRLDTVLKQHGAAIPAWVMHDLRRSAVTGMCEIGVAPHIVEAVVNHVSGHKAGVAGVYNRATYTGEKRVALERWADHVDAIVAGEAPKEAPSITTAKAPRRISAAAAE